MNTGLVTFYHIHHYGACFQACATARAVESLGHRCEIIDYYVNQNNALFRTPTGLNLRSVGENPKAADTLGIDVYRMRYAATIVGCMLMAMGGAFLSTGLLNSFQEDMTANRGFIALAAVIFGRYKPTGVMLATLLFAFGLAVANLLPSINSPIPYNFVTMIPYILTIVVLAGFAGKTVAPAAAGKPYKKG